MEQSEYDVIVVGAGIEGAGTAYNLARNNVRTLLLEQFLLPHNRGSSHGGSRTIRTSYNKVRYARMMAEAFSMWHELEKEEGLTLYQNTGQITICPPHDTSECDVSKIAMDEISAPYEWLDQCAMAKRFPMFKLDEGYCGLYDPSGGILSADKALRSLLSQFTKRGGTLHDGERVSRITPGQRVSIATNKGEYRGKSVVLCAGPWTSKLVQPLGLNLPLKPNRVDVFYWRICDEETFRQAVMPACYFDKAIANNTIGVYGIRDHEYPGFIKICPEWGVFIDPDNRDSSDTEVIRKKARIDMDKFVKLRIPGVVPQPAIQDACIYTTTPDGDFIMDTHPRWKNIVIGAGFSGHGFKLAPVVGKILAALATGRSPTYDCTPYRISRFGNVELSKY